MKIKGFGHNLVKGVKDNASTILTCVSLIGLVGTVIFTAKAAPKVKDRLDEREEDLKDLYLKENLTEEEIKKEKKEIKLDAAKDIAKICAKPAICVVLCAGGTIGAQIKNLSTIAGLSSAVAFYKNKSNVFEEKAKEIIGEGKVTKIKDEIAKDKLDEALNDGHFEITNTGYGNDLFLDKASGQFFICSMEALDRMEIRFNQEILEMYSSYYDMDSAESFEQDAVSWYKDYVGLEIPDQAPYMTWSKSSLLKLIYTYTKRVINGEERNVTIVELGNKRRDPETILAKNQAYCN